MAHRADGLNDIYEHNVTVRKNLDVDSGQITKTPTGDSDIVNKAYVDSQDFWQQVAGVLSPKTATSVELAQLFKISTASTGTYNLNFASYVPDLTSGQWNEFIFGRNESSKNRASMAFYYDGDASNNNALYWLFWGTSPLMALKADGKVGIGTTSPASLLDVRGTLNVGVDGTGHDVKFYGATAGRYMLWDEILNKLVVAGPQRIDPQINTTTALEISGTNTITEKLLDGIKITPVWKPDTTEAEYEALKLGGYIADDNLIDGEYIKAVSTLTLEPLIVNVGNGDTIYLETFKGLAIEPFLRRSDIRNIYGIHYNPTNQIGNTFVNSYGLKLENIPPGSSLTYAIHTGTGAVHFGDDVEILADNKKLMLGATNTDFELYSDGTDACIDYTGNLKINGTVGISATITTAALTPGGATGSMTFVDGILTAQTAAT